MRNESMILISGGGATFLASIALSGFILKIKQVALGKGNTTILN